LLCGCADESGVLETNADHDAEEDSADEHDGDGAVVVK
jgi:hypothetical protein